MGPDEIAKVKDIGASRRTIYNDVEELNALLAQKIDAEQLWVIRRTVALREELMREAWRIYHLPPKVHMVGRGEEKHEEAEDVSWRQLTVIGTIDRIAGSLDRLAFGSKLQVQHEVTTTSEAQKISDKYVKQLPVDEQVALAKAIAHVEELEAQPSSE